jgi:hypothetical protein
MDWLFSSKCFKEEVPGIGKINGDFFSNHAKLIPTDLVFHNISIASFLFGGSP